MAKKKNSAKVQAAMDALEKRFKEPIVSRMDAKQVVKTISTGRPKLDAALGGGIAVGKIIEIYGEEATGKTGLVLEIVKQVQLAGGTVAFIDMEHALNVTYCDQIGVSLDDMLFSQPMYGEQAFAALRALANTGDIDLMVLDSVAAMIPLRELEGETGESMMGVRGRLMSQGLTQLNGALNEGGTTMIFINQLRDSLAKYGSNKVTPGGQSLKFFASQRLEIKNKGQIKVGEDIVGFHQHIKILKNKIAPPFQIVEEDIVFGKGVDDLGGLIDACVEAGILEKKGGWYAYEGENIVNGMKKLRIMLEDNEGFMEALQEKLNELK